MSSLLTAQSLTADSDLDLNDNPIHLSYVQACMSGKTDPAQLAACAANVDGQDLNRYAVAEILSGSQSGTVDQTVLVSAGISSAVAQIAAGTTCGPNQDQSCLTQALGGIAGRNSSGARPQCSQFFKQGWNNIHDFYYSGNNAAKCNNNSGRNRFDNYTYLCKDIPVCE